MIIKENRNYFMIPKGITTWIMSWVIIIALTGFAWMFLTEPFYMRKCIYPEILDMNERMSEIEKTSQVHSDLIQEILFKERILNKLKNNH